MWLTWVVLVSMAVVMYILIYRYERKIEAMNEMIRENRSNLEEHHERINKNHSRLDEHDNHIEQMWVTIPKKKEE